MKSEYSEIGMAYLRPRQKYMMSCTQYILHKEPVKEKIIIGLGYNSICLPDNGGPCVYGCGCIKNLKYWRGDGEIPKWNQFATHIKDVSREKFNEWCELVICKYPQIKRIKLFGSRANGTNKPDSDWDVLIELVEVEHFNQLAKQISFDPDLSFKRFGADVWFLRPDGLVMKYAERGIEKSLKSYPGFQHYRLVRNDNFRDACCKNWFSHIYEEIQNTQVLYEKESA